MSVKNLLWVSSIKQAYMPSLKFTKVSNLLEKNHETPEEHNFMKGYTTIHLLNLLPLSIRLIITTENHVVLYTYKPINDW